MATAGNTMMKPLVRSSMTRWKSKLKCFEVKFKTRFIAKNIGRKLDGNVRQHVRRSFGNTVISQKISFQFLLNSEHKKSVFQYYVLSIFFWLHKFFNFLNNFTNQQRIFGCTSTAVLVTWALGITLPKLTWPVKTKRAFAWRGEIYELVRQM